MAAPTGRSRSGCNAHHPQPCFQRPWLSISRVYAPFRSHAPRHADAPGASQSNASDSCISSLERGGKPPPAGSGHPPCSGHSPSSEHPRVCHRRHSNPARYPVDGAAPDAAVCQPSIRRRSVKLLGEKAPAEPSPPWNGRTPETARLFGWLSYRRPARGRLDPPLRTTPCRQRYKSPPGRRSNRERAARFSHRWRSWD